MKRRRVIGFAAALCCAPVFAAGLGASDRGYLDAARVDPATGVATLMLVIDRPLEDGLTKARVRGKMLAYHQWLFTDQELVKRFPTARLDRGVRLVILHPGAKNALGTSVLEQLVGYARELRFEPVVQPLSRTN